MNFVVGKISKTKKEGEYLCEIRGELRFYFFLVVGLFFLAIFLEALVKYLKNGHIVDFPFIRSLYVVATLYFFLGLCNYRSHAVLKFFSYEPIKKSRFLTVVQKIFSDLTKSMRRFGFINIFRRERSFNLWEWFPVLPCETVRISLVNLSYAEPVYLDSSDKKIRIELYVFSPWSINPNGRLERLRNYLEPLIKALYVRYLERNNTSRLLLCAYCTMEYILASFLLFLVALFTRVLGGFKEFLILAQVILIILAFFRLKRHTDELDFFKGKPIPFACRVRIPDILLERDCEDFRVEYKKIVEEERGGQVIFLFLAGLYTIFFGGLIGYLGQQLK
ncbi:MAG: hypothetical protein B5M53_06740 [Candidatus Cloacimonas sp. 4484_209]|nr:MAG: hypothetical protein B5M53_06740 [Candidatus Cloacimonas sp. 4484_209]